VTKEIWIGEDGQPKPLQPPFQNGNPRPWGFDPYLGAYYVVHVTQVFKGTPNADLRLFSENSTARFWLELGNEYVFFMDDDSFDLPIGEQLSIDTCGNSAHVTNARITLRSLGRLSRPK
jgi:hypothetical protein